MLPGGRSQHAGIINGQRIVRRDPGREYCRVKMDEVLFVANHAFDCIGAKAAGMRTAFIDRRQRPFGDWPYQPDLIVEDFKSLADSLA